MIRTEPIIAVADVEKSSLWYQQLLGCKSLHGGPKFEMLANSDNSIVLYLHCWGYDHHPTMIDRSIPVGNGLLLYLRTDDLEKIRANAQKLGAQIEQEPHLNTNSHQREFSLRDPDGYYITISL